MKKLTAEKDALESHLKNEKDEKELYKVMYCTVCVSDFIYVTAFRTALMKYLTNKDKKKRCKNNKIHNLSAKK